MRKKNIPWAWEALPPQVPALLALVVVVGAVLTPRCWVLSARRGAVAVWWLWWWLWLWLSLVAVMMRQPISHGCLVRHPPEGNKIIKLTLE